MSSVLDLLDGQFRSLSTGVGQGEFAFWLGSGISRAALPDLRELIADVIDFVAERARNEDVDGPHSRALGEILSHAGLSDEERSSLEIGQPARDWPCWAAIAPRLVRVYSNLMDVPVDGFDEDYLLWEGVDVRATYGRPNLEPDVEHICVALLAAEGAVPVVVTANWDGLVEEALRRLLGDRRSLRVCVRGEDVRGPDARTTMYKIHGCAVLAALEPELYRPNLIVRASQIVRWPAADEHAVVREKVVDVATSKPTLMIGLSAQDGNIQNVFAVAENRMRWPWPTDPIAHVFAEDKLAASQRTVLRCTYPNDYAAHGREIEEAALLRAYGKPLLVALVLHVLAEKAALLARVAVEHLSAADRDILADGVREIRNGAARVATDPSAFIQQAISTLACALAAVSGEVLDPADIAGCYRPVSSTPTHQLLAEAGIASDGRAELAVAVGLLGLGCLEGRWNVTVSGEPGFVLVVNNGSAASRVVLASSAVAALKLADHHLVDLDASDAVLVIGGDVPEPMRRSPSSAPGRTGRADARSVHMHDVLRGATDLESMRSRFQQEALL